MATKKKVRNRLRLTQTRERDPQEEGHKKPGEGKLKKRTILNTKVPEISGGSKNVQKDRGNGPIGEENW